MSAFVRMLFGDPLVLRWPKALADAANCVIGRKHPEGTITYAYGVQNNHFLRYLLVKPDPIQIGDSGVCSWGATCERNPSGRRNETGHVNWGISCWRHKLEIIKRAVSEYGEVVYLDWDCWLMRPLPADFWSEMRKGQPFQAAMLKFSRQIVPDRPMPDGAYKPHGGFVYCRDSTIMDEMMALSVEFPTYHDETLYGIWIERHWGSKWKAVDAVRWIEEGWEPYAYGCRHQVRHVMNPVFWEGRNRELR